MQGIDPEMAIQMVLTEKVIAYDSETSGLEITDFICGHVITSSDASIYVPVRHEPGGNIPDPDSFEAALAAAFRERTRKGYRTVGHHLGFDLRATLRHGIVIGSPVEDTMINEAIIDDLTNGYSLADCAKRHGVTAKLGDELYRAIAARFGGIPDKKQMANYWRMPGDDPVVVDYATGDGISTLELWESQQPILDAEDLRQVWKLECDVIPYVARVHHRGLKVDMEYAESVEGTLKTAIAESMKDFTPGFNVRSPTEVEKLFRINGYEDSQFDRTATGKTSFTEKWLETSDIGNAILDVRRLEKARDSFIAPLAVTKNINGRVHPILHQSKTDDFGVIGARFSCSDPNLQAFAKRNKRVGKVVRPLIKADHDWLFEEADFKQQEPRFFTHYSECQVLIDGYRAGTTDIHDIADSYFNLGRDLSKRIGLGILTGMGIKALAGHMRWSFAQAKDARYKFLDLAFPEIKQFQADATETFIARGYVKSILGRKARLEGRAYAYRATSRIIQNSGGDHMKTAFLRACQWEDAYPNDINILMTIHDSNLWQRDPGHDITELVKAIEGVAQEPAFNLLVPIPVDVGSGRNWCEASYGSK